MTQKSGSDAKRGTLGTETGAAKEGRSTAGTEHGMVGVVQRKEPEDVGGENPRLYW